MLPTPPWYGRRYPRLEDLEAAAEALGVAVFVVPVPTAAAMLDAEAADPFLLIPSGRSGLETSWLLAHELGHVMQHAGPRGALLYDKDERAADRWAACALIPEARILRHGNASQDAFIAALSAHYGPIPPTDNQDRELAGYIARIRLSALPQRPRVVRSASESGELLLPSPR